MLANDGADLGRVPESSSDRDATRPTILIGKHMRGGLIETREELEPTPLKRSVIEPREGQTRHPLCH
jgi:hypothetical protein